MTQVSKGTKALVINQSWINARWYIDENLDQFVYLVHAVAIFQQLNFSVLHSKN